MDSHGTPQQDKTSKFDGIEDALDVETSIAPASKPLPPEKKIEEISTSTKEQLKKDYEYTRGNLYSLIEKGQEAVDGILELAQEFYRKGSMVDTDGWFYFCFRFFISTQ